MIAIPGSVGILPAEPGSAGFQPAAALAARAPYPLHYYNGKIQALNPNIVADLQLRAPTEAEMAKATFPRAEYEAGKFLGVWDQPTSGWGALENDGKFRQMWVLDWNPPVTGATMIMVQ